MEKATVEATQDGCNLNDVLKFQAYFAEKATAIIVYAFSTFAKGADPLYDGSKLVLEKAERMDHKLYILFFETARHFQPILNLVGASGCHGFCAACNKGYKSIENHKCKAKCGKCFQSPPCESTGIDIVKCLECSHGFFWRIMFPKPFKTQIFRPKILGLSEYFRFANCVVKLFVIIEMKKIVKRDPAIAFRGW